MSLLDSISKIVGGVVISNNNSASHRRNFSHSADLASLLNGSTASESSLTAGFSAILGGTGDGTASRGITSLSNLVG